MPKAMIFAAGLGTRLMPLTANKPKALVELVERTFLQRTVDKLTRSGIDQIVINIHHFPELMRQAIGKLETNGATIHISDESHLLLDTGGGLLKAAEFLKGKEPIILHNVDIVSDIDLKEMLSYHNKHQALATLAVSRRSTSRYFLWDNKTLCGWINKQTGARIDCRKPEGEIDELAFSGIHIIDPGLLDMITETGVFSINKVYLRLAALHKIMAFEHNPAFWADLGTIEKLKVAEELVKNHPHKFS